MRSTRLALSVALANASLMIVAAGGVAAQQARDESGPGIEEVVVTGVRGSIKGALENKRYETRVTDSIVAENLNDFPDINLAESLQRVPGVTLDRISSGAPLTVTVRGLSAQFTRIEVNGMGGATGGGGRSGASAGNDGRGFNFNVLPSELFTKAVIAKSPQARNTAGGIAALLELSTPSPFDLEDRTGSVSVQGNWGEESSVNPRASGIFSKQISDTFAVLAGAVYSEQNFETSTAEFGRLVGLGSVSADPGALTDEQATALVPDRRELFARDRSTDNYSLLTTAEWRPTERASLRFDALYSSSDGYEGFTGLGYETNRNVGVPASLTISANGVATSGVFPEFNQTRVNFEENGIEDTFQQYTLRGDFELLDFAGATWSASPFIGYNEREIKRSFDRLTYAAAGDRFAYSLTDDVDDFSTNSPGPIGRADEFRIASIFAADNDGDSDQLEIQLNFEGAFDAGIVRAVRFGARYAARESSVAEPFFGALNFAGSPNLTDVVSSREFNLGDGFASDIYDVDFIPVRDALLGGQDLLDPNFDIAQSQLSGIVIGSDESNALAASTVGEDVLSGYVEADIEIARLFINLGVRVVSTDQDSSGNQNVDGIVTPVDVTNSYTEVLPALNARYNLTEDLFIRAAYSKALSRPSLQGLSPRETFNFNTLIGSRGNPALEPFVVDQFDIGAEWYFSDESLLAITYFSKDFSSIIAEDTIFLPRDFSNTGGGVAQVEFTQPFNTGDASIDGFEITAQTNLFFLDGPFSDLGVLLNYTELDAEANAETGFGAQQSQPFPNLSPSSYNAGVYYDNGVFDARLNYAWRERFLQAGIDQATSLFQDDFGQLDFTANYRIREGINLQLQALNVLDEELELSQFDFNVPLSRTELERRIVLGVRFEI